MTAPPSQLTALGRKRPRVSVRVRYTRGRRVLRTRGRLILPRGVSRARGCRGRMSVRVKARERTISARRASVRRTSCAFSSRVRFRHRSRFGTARRLVVRVRFAGNSVLTPAKARVRRVRLHP